MESENGKTIDTDIKGVLLVPCTIAVYQEAGATKISFIR
ncbi:MAG: DUF302 domain-containing protein [Nitrososphaerales archaeon]